jgi:hypothetical protein
MAKNESDLVRDRRFAPGPKEAALAFENDPYAMDYQRGEQRYDRLARKPRKTQVKSIIEVW